MRLRSALPPLLLMAASSLSLGCSYVRDARLCARAGELMNGVSEGPRQVPADVQKLRQAAARYGDLQSQLTALATGAPRRLRTPLKSLAKEATFVKDALDRAALAVDQKSPEKYAAERRSLEATTRRIETASREIRQNCGAR